MGKFSAALLRGAKVGRLLFFPKMKKEHGTERSAFCFRCQEVGSLLVWNICPQVQRVKTRMEAQTSALETYWAEAIDKSVLETSGRVSNCIPTACLRWALLFASLKRFDFWRFVGVFCCFSNKLCTAIYSVSQKPEKHLWKTTHAKNDSDIHPILQRRTMLMPVQQRLLNP